MVGDQGIYLMTNTATGMKAPDWTPENTNNLVAYADECNPEKDFDDWYDTKRQCWGGDDGVMFLPAEFIQEAINRTKNGKVAFNVTPKGISVSA